MCQRRVWSSAFQNEPKGSSLMLSPWNGSPFYAFWTCPALILLFLHKPGELAQVSPHPTSSVPNFSRSPPRTQNRPRSMATTTPTCGWVDLPKCKKRCWFAHLPAPEEFRNYVAIMDDFGVDLEMRGHKFQHIMIW